MPLILSKQKFKFLIPFIFIILIVAYISIIYTIRARILVKFNENFKEFKENMFLQNKINISYEGKEVKKNLLSVDLMIEKLYIEKINNNENIKITIPLIKFNHNIFRPYNPTITFSEELEIDNNNEISYLQFENKNKIKARFYKNEMKKFKYRQKQISLLNKSRDLIASVKDIKILFDTRDSGLSKLENHIVSLQSDDLSKFDLSKDQTLSYGISQINLDSNIIIIRDKNINKKIIGTEISDLKIITNLFELYGKGSAGKSDKESQFVDIEVGIKNYKNLLDLIYKNAKNKLEGTKMATTEQLQESFELIKSIAEAIKRDGLVKENKMSEIVNYKDSENLILNISYHQKQGKELEINQIKLSNLIFQIADNAKS